MCRQGQVAECDHPTDAVMWNEWNRRIQCHRCGQTMSMEPPSTPDEADEPTPDEATT